MFLMFLWIKFAWSCSLKGSQVLQDKGFTKKMHVFIRNCASVSSSNMIETVIHHSQISVASCHSWLTSGNPRRLRGRGWGTTTAETVYLIQIRKNSPQKEVKSFHWGRSLGDQICTTGHENKTVLLLSVPDTRSDRSYCPRQESRPLK